jgi:hypothetical protein
LFNPRSERRIKAFNRCNSRDPQNENILYDPKVAARAGYKSQSEYHAIQGIIEVPELVQARHKSCKPREEEALHAVGLRKFNHFPVE